jgi:hypothetical protein
MKRVDETMLSGNTLLTPMPSNVTAPGLQFETNFLLLIQTHTAHKINRSCQSLANKIVYIRPLPTQESLKSDGPLNSDHDIYPLQFQVFSVGI